MITTPFTRTLQVSTGSGDVRDVVVRVGLPEPDPRPGGDYQVLVEIDGFAEPFARRFHGVDEIHAFLEACKVVSQILPALAPAGARITWLDSEDLGFASSFDSRAA